MPTPPASPSQNLPDLLQALQAAVRARDPAAALALARQIEQALVSTQHAHAAIERRLRELLAELDRPAPPTSATPSPTHATRGAAPERNTVGLVVKAEPGTVFPVWFGTNRRPLADGSGFGSERADRTSLGRAEVFIPEAHRFGETGSPFWKRLKRLDLRDDTLRLQRIARHADAASFYAELQQTMQAAQDANAEPQALVFIHGFNVSFEQAAIRAAQIGCDLKIPGATAFFSWPSRGTVAAYPADEATIEASEAAITRFLIDFQQRCGAARVHLIAHSMGNRGLLRALQRIAANAQNAPPSAAPVKFGQIFLAAPDVDRDLFADLASLYPRFATRTTLYASASDLPVHLSHRLHDAPRAGYFEPYTVVPGIDTVAVPDFDIDLLGHSYFAQAEALLHDIFDLMRLDTAPAQRQRMHPMVAEAGTVWRLQR